MNLIHSTSFLNTSTVYNKQVVNNCKNSAISAYLEANKLACQSFFDNGSRNRTAGSETKALILIATAIARVS